MKENRIKQLLSMLSQDCYITSEHLALHLNVSSRTIRNDLKELNNCLKNHGAQVISKPKSGSRLYINDMQKYHDFVDALTIQDNKIPTSSSDRVQYLLEYLLAAENYVKIDDLCDALYVSKSSISQDLKEVRRRLNEYNLELKNRPNYGIKVDGREFDLRLCIANTMVDRIMSSVKLKTCVIKSYKGIFPTPFVID